MLDAAAAEFVATRDAYRETKLRVEVQYELLCILVKYLRKQGVDVPTPEPPPHKFGVRKTKSLERLNRSQASLAVKGA